MKLSQVVEEFLNTGMDAGGWMVLDRLYLRNRLFGLLELSPAECEEKDILVEGDDYLGALVTFQKERGLRADQLADLVTPPPSVLNALFAQRYEKDPVDATTYFCGINQGNKQVSDVQSSTSLDSKFGSVLSFEKGKNKPVEAAYPTCTYCMEREGFISTDEQDSSLTKRMIRMNLDGQTWNYHFSDQQYWQEDALFTSENHHQQVTLNEKINHLNQLKGLFEHYFVASLAKDVTHPHYIGGVASLPIMAAAEKVLSISELFNQVELFEVVWPVTSLRLKSTDRQQLKLLEEFVVAKWQGFNETDPTIIKYSKDGKLQTDIIFHQMTDSADMVLGVLAEQQTVKEFEALETLDMFKAKGLALAEFIKGM
ncbi:hypothetical protein G7081_04575 [Vagococcus coleopterorum]|uniref:Galactose-1-phosphate uridylyltransferase n=1 Tax=Vagococcus coleopterorum TaxID=2714946 RepID=A0A6G8AMT5_9ENTE|nr:hypothetical protein [Vagococcus coleopterorum]QIL46391.1 hypothetical protein G7081_04575 [Vagococcus coleopterorum]